ncbi:MAG: GIY-YIG nuclease family protein [Candidatus Pacebacteria bacterium]|nr:GIY-YIG nuclease family protein [Candidatus Paceibacterota bacterium]
MQRKYYTYIVTNKRNTVIYTGITNNIEKRMFEHKNKLIKGFTSKYNINKLVWCESFNNPEEAISAEKRIKGWTRQKKINLIKSINPNFKNLIG